MAESPVEAKHESEVTPPAEEEQTEFDDDTKRAIAEVYKTEGDDAYARKDFSSAIQFYKDGIDVNCNDDKLNADLKKAMADAYKDQGNDAFKRKDYSNAVHFYTEGLQVNCKDDELNAKLYSNRATAHFHQGNYEDTIIDATIAVDLQPTYVKAIERGANACIQLRQYEEAIEWCDKGLKINKENKTLVGLRSRSVDERNKSQMTRNFPGGISGGFPGGFAGAAGGFPGGAGSFLGGAGGFPGASGAGGFPESVTGGGETPILNDLLSDRELLAAFQDPAAMEAFQDVSQNPDNLSKYGNNPNLKTIIDKLDKKFGPPGPAPPPGSGGGGLDGMMGGGNGGMGGMMGGGGGGFSAGGMPFGNMFGGL